MIIMGVSIFVFKPKDADIKKEKDRIHADSVKRGLVQQPGAPVAKAADTAKNIAAKPATADSAVLKTPFGAATVGAEKFVTLENKDRWCF